MDCAKNSETNQLNLIVDTDRQLPGPKIRYYRYRSYHKWNKTHKMDKSMELILSKLYVKQHQQTLLITTKVTKNVMDALEQDMKIITEENNAMKNKMPLLEQKVNNMEMEKRKNNLIFFGIEDMKRSQGQLVDHIKEIITDMEISLDSHEILKVYRIGEWIKNKKRHVCTFFHNFMEETWLWKTNPGVYAKEAIPKENESNYSYKSRKKEGKGTSHY